MAEPDSSSGRHNMDVGAEVRDAQTRTLAAFERMASFAAFGSRVARLPAAAELPPASAVIRFGGPRNDPSTFGGEADDVRDNFAQYCARFAVVGMVTACEEFLHRMLFIVRLAQSAARNDGTITGAEFQDIRDRTRKEVRNSSVDAVILKLFEDHPIHEGELPGLAWFRSVYGMRKCLIHRNGTVGADDVGGDGVLRATWRRIVLLIGDQEVTELPAVANEGSAVSVRFEDAVNSWSEGDSINIGANECQEIGFALAEFAGQVSNLVLARIPPALSNPVESTDSNV